MTIAEAKERRKTMAEMSADFAERFRDFAKYLPASLVEKGLSLSWVAGSDGEPAHFFVKGNPEAWHAFLQSAIALIQQEKHKDGTSQVALWQKFMGELEGIEKRLIAMSNSERQRSREHGKDEYLFGKADGYAEAARLVQEVWSKFVIR